MCGGREREERGGVARCKYSSTQLVLFLSWSIHSQLATYLHGYIAYHVQSSHGVRCCYHGCSHPSTFQAHCPLQHFNRSSTVAENHDSLDLLQNSKFLCKRSAEEAVHHQKPTVYRRSPESLAWFEHCSSRLSSSTGSPYPLLEVEEAFASQRSRREAGRSRSRLELNHLCVVISHPHDYLLALHHYYYAIAKQRSTAPPK